MTTRGEIGLGGGEVGAGDLQGEDGAQKGRVLVRVQQVELAVAAELLVGVDEIKGEHQRAFLAFADHHVGGHPMEMDPDVGVGLTVHGELGGNFDVRVLEVSEFLFPVGVLEFEEEGAQDIGGVERGVGE